MRVGTSSRKLIGETTRPARARDEEGRCVIALPRQQSAVSQRRIATQNRAKSKREISPVYYTLCPQLFRQRHQLDGLFFVTSIEFFCLRM